MRTLTPAERRTFRARAHHLHPFVIVGQHGLTPAVLHEIDVNLLAHELIKIRVASDDRVEREALLARISDELDAAPVQHLGKILTIWRPSPEPEPVAPKSRAKTAANAAKRKRPQARGDEARKRGAPAGPRGTARANAIPFARRGGASAVGHEPAQRPPRGKSSGQSRNRASSLVGDARPRASVPGTRRRRTPR